MENYSYKYDEHVMFYFENDECLTGLPWQLPYGYLMRTQYIKPIRFDERDIMHVMETLLSKDGNVSVNGDICTIELTNGDVRLCVPPA